MVLYLSTILGISIEYYEAAKVDGATKWQQIRHVTLPLLKPTVITMLILSISKICMSDFRPVLSGALKTAVRCTV